MKPILFNGNETAFTSNGLGRLDPLSCTVTEERNGQFELEMVISMDDRHYDDVQEGRLILARHDENPDLQPFEIYKISRPLNGQVTVFAHHISYRSSRITVAPFTASGIMDAVEKMQMNFVGEQPFTIWTDKSVQGTFKVTQPTDLRSLLGGTSGSLLDVYGTGEYEWDRFSINLHLHRGIDSGVTLRYGKDITELKKTTDISDLWTGVVPFWHKEEDGVDILVMLPELAVMSETAAGYDYSMIVPLDLSDAFEEAPSEDQLREKAESYVSAKAMRSVPTTIDVSFINLGSLEEYRNVAPLQRLRLCDTLTILHTRLGVSNTAKIIKTVYDVLTEKYISMTVGEASTNLDSALTADLRTSLDDLKTSTALNLKRTRREMERETQQLIEDQTTMITGGAGGHVVLKIDADGKTREILFMDTDDMNTASQVLRINMNGIGFSSNGINGPYDSAWTLDGKFNARFIQTGILNASVIRAGIIEDLNQTNYWNLDTGDFCLSASATVGGSTVDDIVETAVSEYDLGLDQQAVFNKLTDNGDTQGIYLSNGKLYINAEYIKTGKIADAENKNFWNLETGEFSLSASATVGGSTVDAIASTAASSAVSAYDTSLTQLAVFNKLTDNGGTQGIYLSNGKLYINAEYIKTGKIADTQNKNFWNLETGEFSLSASATVGGSTVNAIATTAANAAISTYDTSLTQQAVFNKLTDNGQTQGIYLSGGKLYINASYIATGSLSATYISGGTLTLGGENDTSGKLVINNANGSKIGSWTKDGIEIKTGSIDLGSGNFTVSASGELSAKNASINGKIYTIDNIGKAWLELDHGQINGAYNSTTSQGKVYFGTIYDENHYGLWLEGKDYLGLYAPNLFVNNTRNYGRAYNGTLTIVSEADGLYREYNLAFINGLLMSTDD